MYENWSNIIFNREGQTASILISGTIKDISPLVFNILLEVLPSSIKQEKKRQPICKHFICSDQCHVWLSASPWTAAHQVFLSIANSQSLLKLMSIELVMPSNHLILCCPLLLLPSIFPSIRVFSNESVLSIRWPKYWSFSFSISPSQYSGLISCRIDWLDLLAIQGTLKSLLKHHSSKASIL